MFWRAKLKRTLHVTQGLFLRRHGHCHHCLLSFLGSLHCHLVCHILAFSDRVTGALLAYFVGFRSIRDTGGTSPDDALAQCPPFMPCLSWSPSGGRWVDSRALTATQSSDALRFTRKYREYLRIFHSTVWLMKILCHWISTMARDCTVSPHEWPAL